MAHQIRLAGPWEFSTGPDHTSVRCQLPYALPDGVTVATLQRRFHRPSGLSQETRLSLVIVASAALTSLTLNGDTLVPDLSTVAEIELEGLRAVQQTVSCTSAVAEFNELSVPLTAACRQIFTVHLLIEEPEAERPAAD